MRLLVSRVRPPAEDKSRRMLPSADRACSMPCSSWVTVATHSSLAAVSVALTICWTASFRATSEHSKHCRWSSSRSRESCAGGEGEDTRWPRSPRALGPGAGMAGPPCVSWCIEQEPLRCAEPMGRGGGRSRSRALSMRTHRRCGCDKVKEKTGAPSITLA